MNVVEAQGRVYDRAVETLLAGRKSSHWMSFIFPQVDPLGWGSLARRYAISCREEAKAYVAHPLLGSRLRERTSLVLAAEQVSLREIFGTPDYMKFRSKTTLFDETAPGGLFSGPAVKL